MGELLHSLVDVGDVLGIAPVCTGDAEEADDLVTTHERGTGVGLLKLHALRRGEPTDPVTMAPDGGLGTAHRCQVVRTTRAIEGDDAELLTSRGACGLSFATGVCLTRVAK